jgi:subtilisin family serine protease
MLALLIAIIASAGVAVGASSLGGGGSNSGGAPAIPVVVYNTNYSANQSGYYATDEYNAQYGLNQINAAEAYASLNDQGLEVAGAGVSIGIVDSGVQSSHSEISVNFDSVNSYNYIDSNTDVTDENGHGTHVSSIAAGAKNGSGMHGVAYNATIISAKAFGAEGTGADSDIANAISGVVTDGAKVINMSFGSAVASSAKLTALKEAVAADVVLVAATGNDAYAEPGYPAAYAYDVDDGIAGFEIAVGAVDSSSTIASFSNQCGLAKDYCLVAPGVNIYAGIPTDSYGLKSGTSMATPHVAGAAAVIRGAWPSLTADEVVSILLSTATDLGDTGVDVIYGHGLLNLEAAVAPVGVTTVSSGTDTSSAGYDISSTSLTSDPIFGDAFSTNVASQLSSAVFFDDYGRNFKANLDTKISQTSSYTVPTLDSIAFNNYNSQIIPLSFGTNSSSQLKFQVKSYNNSSESGNGLSKNYSKNRYGLKFLVMDKSQEDKYLTNSEGFSFVQDLSKNLQAGFAFNSNEASNVRGDRFNNVGFMSVNNFAANPYQSFVSGSAFTSSGIQRNYNQLFVSQKFFDNKFAANFSHQTAYETSSVVSQIGNRQNQVSDLSFTYLPGHESNVSVSFGNLNEFNNNFLNSKALGAFETAGDVKTSYFKISSTKKLVKNLYLITSFSEGATKANGNDIGIFREYSNIKSRSSSIGLINDEIFGGKMGLVYSEPLRVYSGKVSINVPVGLDANGNAIRYSGDVSLRPQGKEQDFEVFFSKNLNDDSHVKFNFITQKEAGNVKTAPNNYLGFVTYGKKF